MMKKRFGFTLIIYLILVVFQSCQPGERESHPIQKIIAPVSAPEIFEDAEIESEKVKVNESLDKILDLFSHSTNQIAASWIVYSGEDSTRNWKSVFRYSVKDEKVKVDIMSAKVRMLSEEASEMKKGKFRIETESEGTWYIQELIYTFPDGKTENKYFGFLKVNEKYCHADID